ncbi:amidohydrolase family protein [Streptosporangium minutum]|uniref:Amidohydrolase 3 domain-containing protein n=1 Tax=Streptosporangium minutum TaxID=569862 RepID=A0A243RJ20_9ACTN|nr:amidohydrolase family protein [Streptosporangium minutum]OUC94880.1 hypothetical protein CA984_20780 [Streptosporangium minutum]
MHDLILRAGTVHDGFGSAGRTADVAVSGGRIVAIGREPGPAARVIDADGLIVAPGFVDPHSHSVGPNHTRTFGTFPVFLGTYVRERGVVPMPEAIRKVTSATAAQFGPADRGWLGTGAVADVCVFDPVAIRHDGTYEVPDVAPVGVTHVFPAGHPVVEGGEFTGGRHGRVLRR